MKPAALTIQPAITAPETLEQRFQALVSTHRERAVRMAWRLVGGDLAAAEDIAQEAFVKAWQALPTWRGDSELSTWFYRILLRQAANHRRWQGVRTFWHGLMKVQSEEGYHDLSRDAALQKRLAKALEQLSPGQREVFVLVHLEGFTLTEVAELLGKAPGTLKSHLHRALESLRESLQDVRLPDVEEER
ncbi:MAG: RNA polymerase sigma factor [Myxococcota bacterium]